MGGREGGRQLHVLSFEHCLCVHFCPLLPLAIHLCSHPHTHTPHTPHTHTHTLTYGHIFMLTPSHTHTRSHTPSLTEETGRLYFIENNTVIRHELELSDIVMDTYLISSLRVTESPVKIIRLL